MSFDMFNIEYYLLNSGPRWPGPGGTRDPPGQDGTRTRAGWDPDPGRAGTRAGWDPRPTLPGPTAYCGLALNSFASISRKLVPDVFCLLLETTTL